MFASGRIKAHAVLAKERLAMAPEIPTVDEAGLPGFYVSTWYGLWAPKGAPPDIIAKLNAAAVEALGRSGGGAAAHRHGLCHHAARPADARGTRRASQGGDREVVGDHQGGRRQSGVG